MEVRDRVEFRMDRQDRPVAVLSNRWGRAEVMFWGARVTSCRFGDDPAPVLFEPAAGFDYADVGRTMIHGGIPVTWPWFSSGKSFDTWWRRYCRTLWLPVNPAPSYHGTARYTVWDLRAVRVTGETSEVELGLRPTDESREYFDGDFDVRLVVTLGKNALGVRLFTRNVGTEPFTYGEGFHPYFYVGDAFKATMGGFDGCRYESGRELPEDVTGGWKGNELPLWPGCDTFWMKSDRHVTWIRDPILRRTITVSTRGVRNIVTWFHSLKTSDTNITQAESRNFVCLEPTNYKPETKVTLAPGEEHEFAMEISVQHD